MRKDNSRYAKATDGLDIEALLAEINGTPAEARQAANDVARVQHGRVIPLPMAA